MTSLTRSPVWKNVDATDKTTALFDQYAGMAMQSLLAQGTAASYADHVKAAFDVAEMMMDERARRFMVRHEREMLRAAEERKKLLR